MPMTRPFGLRHLLPGEQSVSNEHAMAWTVEKSNAKAASLHFLTVIFINHSEPAALQQRYKSLGTIMLLLVLFGHLWHCSKLSVPPVPENNTWPECVIC